MSRVEHLAEGVALYLGDCREILPTLGKVDLVATDPPYPDLKGGGSLPQGGVGRRKRESITLGDVWEANYDWVPSALAAAQRGVLVFCSHHSVSNTEAAFAALKSIALLTWYKRNTPAAMKGTPRYVSEFIWAFSCGPGLNWSALETVKDIPNLNAGCVSTGERVVLSDGSVAHPAQKPLALMEWLLGIGGESVLDPFMGTGTTGVAAVKLGRKFIGIEREPKYFEIARRRIQSALDAPSMFIGAPIHAKLETLELFAPPNGTEP